MRVDKDHKLVKYKVMRKSDTLYPHLPKTNMLTSRTFRHFIKKYHKVILKPSNGSRGIGVYKVSARGRNKFFTHHEHKTRTIKGKKLVYRYIRRKIGTRGYLVQRYIPLATVDNRPFDMRVIVQRRKNSRIWKVTGWIAKVAGPGYIVTNISRSKGTVLPLLEAIKKSSSLKHHSAEHLAKKINKIALKSANKLSEYYAGHRIYGLDMGLDKDGHIWIIEANLTPILSHFRKLKDPKMYNQILYYKNG